MLAAHVLGAAAAYWDIVAGFTRGQLSAGAIARVREVMEREIWMSYRLACAGVGLGGECPLGVDTPGPRACSRPGNAWRAAFLQSRTSAASSRITIPSVGTSWGLGRGNPWHEVAATGRNWLVKYRQTLVTREPDHLAKVRVAGSNPVVRSIQVRGLIRVRA
jgi:hypothetical protein